MADRDYVIRYDTSSAVPAAKNVGQLTTAITALDSIEAKATASGKKIVDVFNQIATSGAKALKIVEALNAAMAAGTAQADSFATKLTGVAVAELDIEKAAKGANAATGQLNKGMDKGAVAAKAFGHEIDLAAAAARSGSIPIASVGTSADAAVKGLNDASKATGKLAKSMRATADNAADAAKSLDDVKTNTEGIGGAAKTTAGEVDGLEKAFKRFITAAMAMEAVKKVLGAIGDSARESREYMEDNADASLEQRASLNELANLMGEQGVTDRVLGRVFGTSLSTGWKIGGSAEFQQEAEGSMPAGIEKGNIREDQKAAVLNEAAITGARLGMKPGTAGDMAGVFTMHDNFNVGPDGKPLTPEQAAAKMSAKMDAVGYALNAGRGKMDVLARGTISQAMKAVSEEGGRVADDVEMSAILGTSSLFAKYGASAGTEYAKASRLVNRANEKNQTFLDEAGVSAAHGDVAKWEALKAHLEKKRAEVGPSFNVDQYLQSAGNFGQASERESIVGMMGVVGTKDKPGILEGRIAESRKLEADTAGAVQKNREWQASLSTQGEIASRRGEIADLEQGKKMEAFMVARRNAMAQLKGEGSFKGQDQLMADKVRGGFGLDEFMGLPAPIQQRVNERAIENASKAAKEAGVAMTIGKETQATITEGIGHEVAPIDLNGNSNFADMARSYLKAHPEEAADIFTSLYKAGVPGALGNGGGIEAGQHAYDRGAEGNAAWEAAKGMQPGAPVTQPVDMNATPREPASPILPTTPDGKRFGVVDAGGAQPGGANGATVVKVDGSADLKEAARMLLAFVQQAGMPPLPTGGIATSFNDGGYRT